MSTFSYKCFKISKNYFKFRYKYVNMKNNHDTSLIFYKNLKSIIFVVFKNIQIIYYLQ